MTSGNLSKLKTDFCENRVGLLQLNEGRSLALTFGAACTHDCSTTPDIMPHTASRSFHLLSNRINGAMRVNVALYLFKA